MHETDHHPASLDHRVVALSPPALHSPTTPQPRRYGQPNQSAEDQLFGAAGFSSGGFANAEQHYAGTQPQNSRNAIP